MEFKQKCVEFLDSFVAMRAEAINKAVKTALETEYTPYASSLLNAKNEVIAEETRKKQELIATIEADYRKVVDKITLETEQALANKRNVVETNAEKKAKANYDNFISQFTALAEKTNIN